MLQLTDTFWFVICPVALGIFLSIIYKFPDAVTSDEPGNIEKFVKRLLTYIILPLYIILQSFIHRSLDYSLTIYSFVLGAIFVLITFHSFGLSRYIFTKCNFDYPRSDLALSLRVAGSTFGGGHRGYALCALTLAIIESKENFVNKNFDIIVNSYLVFDMGYFFMMIILFYLFPPANREKKIKSEIKVRKWIIFVLAIIILSLIVRNFDNNTIFDSKSAEILNKAVLSVGVMIATFLSFISRPVHTTDHDIFRFFSIVLIPRLFAAICIIFIVIIPYIYNLNNLNNIFIFIFPVSIFIFLPISSFTKEVYFLNENGMRKSVYEHISYFDNASNIAFFYLLFFVIIISTMTEIFPL
jgi:hypothetical protein